MESGMPNIAAGVSPLSLSLCVFFWHNSCSSYDAFKIDPVSHETPDPITTCVEQKISQLICCNPAPGSIQKEEATTGSIVVKCETAY
jgi:hypothetical protein